MPKFLSKITTHVTARRRMLLLLVVGVLMIAFYDVIFDMALSFLHTSFEWLEFVLEKIIEGVFHTTRKQTQILAFYLMFSVGAYGCYRLGRKLIDVYQSLIRTMSRLKEASKTHFMDKWSRLSASQKFNILLSGSAGIGVVVYLSLN